MPRISISNKAQRNVSLMFAIAFSCGLVYCIYATICKGSPWITICPVVITISIFIKSYLYYRKEAKKDKSYSPVKQ